MGQGNHTSWMSDGHQQHTTRIADDLHQEINVTGRLSQASSPQDTHHMTNGMCCTLILFLSHLSIQGDFS